jgi:hypothetical protein
MHRLKKPAASPLLVMPLPPSSAEWLMEYCAAWRTLLEAQEKIIEAQRVLLQAQKKLLEKLEARAKRPRRQPKAVG